MILDLSLGFDYIFEYITIISPSAVVAFVLQGIPNDAVFLKVKSATERPSAFNWSHAVKSNVTLIHQK